MFFALSKTFGVMLIPANFLLLTGLAGIVLLMTRFARAGRRLLVAAILLLAFCAFSPIGYVLLYPLEQRFPPWDPAKGPPDGIIVLGGSIDPDLSEARGEPVVRTSPGRIIVAAELARRYPNARLVFTGGSANLVSNDAKEGDHAARVFEGLGIDPGRLVIERASRNTYENAEFTKALLSPTPGQRWLLVTSAYHMPRSVGLFRRAGFNIEAHPVDWRVGGRGDLLSFTQFADEGLGRTDFAFREWVGLVAYRLAGKTDELLPGPR